MVGSVAHDCCYLHFQLEGLYTWMNDTVTYKGLGILDDDDDDDWVHGVMYSIGT